MATPFLGEPFWKTIRTDYPERVHVTPVASPYSWVLSHAFIRRNYETAASALVAAIAMSLDIPDLPGQRTARKKGLND
jgi:hypothetical protein